MSEILSLGSIDSNALTARQVGDVGEELAARFLERNGYRLMLANFKVPIGRNLRGATVTGEIDLIAFDENILCFVEVKTRSSDAFAAPIAAVDLRKQRQIIRTAKVYREIFRLSGIPFRYDAIGIVLRGEEKPEITLYRNFWTEDKFRKKSWVSEIW